MDDRAPKLLNPLHWPRRTQALALLVPLVIFLLLLIRHPRSTTSSVVSFFSNTPRCPPEAWALGSWVQRPGPWPTMGGPVDVFRVSGFSGCASSNEPWFHLAHENASMWEWRAQVSTYDWRPGSGCSMQEFDKQKFIQDLLARGGWHMVGGEYVVLSAPHQASLPVHVEHTHAHDLRPLSASLLRPPHNLRLRLLASHRARRLLPYIHRCSRSSHLHIGHARLRATAVHLPTYALLTQP